MRISDIKYRVSQATEFISGVISADTAIQKALQEATA